MLDAGKFVLIAGMALCLGEGVAQAQSTVLYRTDYNIGTDYMALALTESGYNITTVTGALSSYDLSNYNLVVYANQNYGEAAGDTASLNSYIGGGGKVIYDDWSQANVPNIGGIFSGNNDINTITVGASLLAGITNPLLLGNPGWGVWSTGLAATSGTAEATFDNGDAAVIMTGTGQTFFNGFLTDTGGTVSEQLYYNEINYAVTGQEQPASPVPEPASLALLSTGLLAAAAMRRKKPI